MICVEKIVSTNPRNVTYVFIVNLHVTIPKIYVFGIVKGGKAKRRLKSAFFEEIGGC